MPFADVAFAAQYRKLREPSPACEVHIKTIILWPTVTVDERLDAAALGDAFVVKIQRPVLSIIMAKHYPVPNFGPPGSPASRLAYVASITRMLRDSFGDHNHAGRNRGFLTYQDHKLEDVELVVNQDARDYHCLGRGIHAWNDPLLPGMLASLSFVLVCS